MQAAAEAAANPLWLLEQLKIVSEQCDARSALPQWVIGRQYPVIENTLYFMSIREERKLVEVVDSERQSGSKSRTFFTIDNKLVYLPFCSDFGPLHIGCVYKFNVALSQKIEDCKKMGQICVLYTSDEPRQRTNSATLLGCFLVLHLGWTPEEAWSKFQFANKDPFVPFRDASFEPETFNLLPIQVLEGLAKAKKVGILDLEHFDLGWFEYCDHPANADLHLIVPGKFVAFKGPKKTTHFNEDTGIMDFAPTHYSEIFEDVQVSAVVRLNEPCYDKSQFEKMGVKHYDIYFDDCSTPDEEVLNKWFDVCRREKGAIAVHCKAGLGRTGTLICVWLMRKYRFTGREVVGFIRVMRPGSILGSQQEFLEDNEEYFWSLGDPDVSPPDGRGDCLPASDDEDADAKDRARVTAARKEHAARRAQENTEAMNRRAAAASGRY